MQGTQITRCVGILAAWAIMVSGAWAQIPPASPSTAATGDISGSVRDKLTGMALLDANIGVLGTKWGAVSVEDGSFIIKNLPVGSYDLIVQMMGYGEDIMRGIEVEEGGKARVIFELKGQIVTTLTVVKVTGERKLIDKGDTGTSHNISSDDISALPVDDVEEVIGLKAGVIAKGGELHFRGGRGGEVQYQVDGVAVRDPLVGQTASPATLAISEVDAVLGGMDAKYGNAQSGVVLYRTKEGGPNFSGEIRYQTDDYGSPSNTFDNYDRIFIGLGGPLPVHNLTYYLSGEATYQDPYPKTTERRSRRKELDFISVGDRQNNSTKVQVKLAYKASPNHKLTFETTNQKTRSDSYIHCWSQVGFVQEFLDTTRTQEVVLRHGRWSPLKLDSTYVYYNAAEHTPNYINEFNQYKAVLNHTLSKNARYEFKVSHQHFYADSRVLDKNEWEYDGERHRDYWFNYTDGQSYDFFVISGDYPYLSVRDTHVYQGIFDLTYKKGDHTFETGFTAVYNDMRYFSVTRPYNNDANGYIGQPRTKYHYYNPEGGIYIQDRWEHEGMVINCGVRYDIFSVGQQVALADVQERVKTQFSPRIGIAYPISDRDVFSFHYGRFYQIPDRQFLFDDLDSYDTTRGNPNLTNETTVAYQAAIQHLFSDILVGQFSVFYRDIFGQVTAELTQDWASTGNIQQYVNKDYASARGFEVNLSRAFRDYLMWNVSYAYMVATGVSSDPSGSIARNFVYLPTGEQPLNWDTRHSFGASINIADQRNWGIGITWDYMTGYPYTPQQRDTREQEPEMLNSRRLPSKTTLAVRLDKYYQVWGKRLSLFLDGRNVLDAKNLRDIQVGNPPGVPVGDDYMVYYTETGRIGGAYLQDRDGDGVEDFIALNDPRVYETPRSVRIGIGFQF
ncbi:MAG: TonB-dependent receptor [Candidatus Eisenbacteria sp.]|nr:TonB-dependent receptor [Candidatus Eisenbacteria bacterium]